jgi:hypothetical protein
MRQTRREKHTQGNTEKAGNYRKPPKEHQFKPGKSGNPRGRPKKKLSPTDGLAHGNAL